MGRNILCIYNENHFLCKRKLPEPKNFLFFFHPRCTDFCNNTDKCKFRINPSRFYTSWIRVNDRLPYDNLSVITLDENNIERSKVFYRKGKWQTAFFEGFKIKLWRPKFRGE